MPVASLFRNWRTSFSAGRRGTFTQSRQRSRRRWNSARCTRGGVQTSCAFGSHPLCILLGKMRYSLAVHSKESLTRLHRNALLGTYRERVLRQICSRQHTVYVRRPQVWVMLLAILAPIGLAQRVSETRRAAPSETPVRASRERESSMWAHWSVLDAIPVSTKHIRGPIWVIRSPTSRHLWRRICICLPASNCHGPGAAHVRAVSSAGEQGIKDLAIVNPARLTADLANNICMACHEIGDERILRPGKTYGDVRPGAPLDNVLSILMVPPTRDSPPQADHLQHYYSMTLSKCYRATGGGLRCITCHDPHMEPSSQQAPAYFDKKCLSCHTEQSCKLSEEKRQQSAVGDDCIGCHMPKRKIGFIARSSLTNHRIVALPDEPFPQAAYAQTAVSLPGLIHLNPAPGRKTFPHRRSFCCKLTASWQRISRSIFRSTWEFLAIWRRPSLTTPWCRPRWDEEV